jgi:hypothetical protein
VKGTVSNQVDRDPASQWDKTQKLPHGRQNNPSWEGKMERDCDQDGEQKIMCWEQVSTVHNFSVPA